MAKPLSLDNRLNVTAQLVIRSRIFYDIWWFFSSMDMRPKIVKTLNRYPEFFRFDIHAHFVSMVIHLAGLFETRKDTINFNALINEVATSGASDVTVTAAQALMKEIEEIPSKVAILCSNLFGHRSISLSYEEAFRKAELNPDQLLALTVAGLKVVNILLNTRGLSEQCFDELSRADAEQLIIDLGKMYTSAS
jgi:hypothetical protein